MAIINGTSIVKTLDGMKGFIPEPGARVAKIIQKGSNPDGTKRISFAMEAVEITLPEVLEWIAADSAIADAVVTYVQDLQDKCIRTRIEAGKGQVHTSDYDMNAVRTFLATSPTEGRLSEDKIRAWFAVEVADTLMVAFADKLGISDTPTESETKKLEQIVAQYRDNMAKLAGRKTVLPGVVRTNLEKALALVDTDSSIKERLQDKLAEMADAEGQMMGL
jgi:hypothetical protein